VQAFGERFGQAVGQRLEQDRVVVVVVGLEAGHVRIDADAGGDRERADPVLLAAVLRRDEVGQAEVRAFDRLVDLLAQEVQAWLAAVDAGQWLQHHVVADAVRRPQAEHRLRRQPFLRDEPTTVVVRIAGYLPASSQAWKNGVQSMQCRPVRPAGSRRTRACRVVRARAAS
jgi:hypothetical protein